MIRILATMIFAILFGCSQDPKPAERIISVDNIGLTQDEKQFIKENPVITWAVENRPPVLYRNQAGEVTGRVTVYLKIIAQSTGLTFKPIHVDNLTGALKAVKDGKIDLVTSVRPTTNRIDYMGFTAPFADSKAVFLFRIDDMPKVPLRAGILNGDAAREYLITNFPNIKIVETVDNEEAIELLQKELIDVALMHEASVDFIVGQMKNKNKPKLYKVHTDFTYQSSFGFKKDNVILGSIISKVILAIKPEDKLWINNAWREDVWREDVWRDGFPKEE